MDWARILAYVTGTVDQELLGRNEYLAAENRIIKAQLRGRLKLSDAERGALGEIGHRLGRKALVERRHRSPTGHYPGLVSQAYRPQIRRLEGPSRPWQTSDQARGRATDHSHGQREPGLGL
jgi:putative transposase